MSSQLGLSHVFLLAHEYRNPNGEDEYKVIGIFTGLREAMAARKKAATLPGFRKYPRSFSISKMALDHMSWAGGFVTMPPPKRMTEEEWRQFKSRKKTEKMAGRGRSKGSCRDA
jgi:hypothetical protein